MDFNIKEVREQDKKLQEFLSMTRTIVKESDEAVIHDVWIWLKLQYKECTEDCVMRAMCSVINSILHQERICFATSRRGLQDLLKNDRNFRKDQNPGKGFKDSFYRKILESFYKENVFTKIYEPSDKNHQNNQCMAFEVTHPELLKYLNAKVDRNSQYEKVLKFCKDYKNSNKGTTEGTRFGHQRTEEPKNIRIKEHKNTGIEVSKTSKTEGPKTESPQEQTKQDSNFFKQLGAAAAPSALKEPTVNQEHQNLLDQATAVCPQNKFLIGKQDSLNKFGSFTGKQLTILKSIINKPSATSQTAKPLIEKEKFCEILDKNKSDAAAVLAEFNRWSFNQDDKSKFNRCKLIVSDMLTAQLAEQVILAHIGEIYPEVRAQLDAKVKSETEAAAKKARKSIIQPEKELFKSRFNELKSEFGLTDNEALEYLIMVENIVKQQTKDELTAFLNSELKLSFLVYQNTVNEHFNKSTQIPANN